MTQTSLFWTTDSFIKKAAAKWRLPQGPGRPAMMIVAWGMERPDYY